MKRNVFILFIMLLGVSSVFAQKKAVISFEETTHDFGTFAESDGIQTYDFKFTNTGNDMLVIHQAIASCGCTVPQFPKEPIRPGESGVIRVSYNGSGKFPGHFKKAVTIRSNATADMVRLYIEGEMTEKVVDVKKAIKKDKS